MTDDSGWRSFQAMIRAMRKVFPEVKIMIMNKDHLKAIGHNIFYIAPANNDNRKSK